MISTLLGILMAVVGVLGLLAIIVAAVIMDCEQ